MEALDIYRDNISRVIDYYVEELSYTTKIEGESPPSYFISS